MTAIAAHIVTAAERGMKAGFRQFEGVASKSGLPNVQALWDEFEDLNSRGRFNLYCSMYGPVVESYTDEAPVNVPAVKGRTMDDLQALAEQVATLQARVEELEGDDTPKVKRNSRSGGDSAFQARPARRRTSKANLVKPKARKAAPKATKSTSNDDGNVFTANVVKALGYPTKVGAKFTHKGKSGSSKWIVAAKNRDGSIVAVRA